MMSFQKIGYRLTQSGIPTPSDAKNWSGKRTKRGVWESIAVRRIVISETYCGTWYYGKNIGANGRGGKRPKEEQIAVDVPAIVTREIWELAQRRRAYNSRVAKRRAKRNYLLRGGILKCGCGRHMIGSKGRYYCTGHHHTNVLTDRCKEPALPGELIEPLVWEYVMKLITEPDLLEQRLKQAQVQEAQKMQPRQIELEHITALKEQTEDEANDIALAMRKTKGLVADKLEQQALEIDRRHHLLVAREIELQEELKYELTDQMVDNLMQFREVVAVGLDNPSFEDKRRWLELLQVQVTVTNSLAVISCRLHSDERLLEKSRLIEGASSQSWP